MELGKKGINAPWQGSDAKKRSTLLVQLKEKGNGTQVNLIVALKNAYIR